MPGERARGVKGAMLLALLFWAFGASAAFAEEIRISPENPPIDPIDVTGVTPNELCLDCHGVPGFKVKTKGEDGRVYLRKLTIDVKALNNSVHKDRKCVECHPGVVQIPHIEEMETRIICEMCHREVLSKRRDEKNGSTEALSRLKEKVQRFQTSTHALARKDDKTRPRAYCTDCHGGHAIFPPNTEGRHEFRIGSPNVCGDCHDKQKALYEESHHGVQSMRFGNLDTAVCSDCHNAHGIHRTDIPKTRLEITRNCGNCHEKQTDTYIKTYHGQVTRLGYAHTAKCYDCHDFHDQQKVENPKSAVHADNRLTTCRKCHPKASEGYNTFYPHGDPGDSKNYPVLWFVALFMELLLLGVFGFFWAHSAIWFLREYLEFGTFKRGHHAGGLVLDDDGNPTPVDEASGNRGCAADGGPLRTHVIRFGLGWRIGHAILAISVILLVLTGTPVLFPDSFWAPHVMALLGGPIMAAFIHRIGAVMFAGVFFAHIAVILFNVLWLRRKTFRWFGPTSLLPRWQDLWDVIAMFKWFFGKGPRPTFDHWSYFEKFDYWAPFWGMFVIGLSGLAMWFPAQVAAFLPGWVFNVATIVHGEEAFLAAVFLFTVHYFNCHFRPAKFPQDLVMFTGSMPLEEFIEERGQEYQRLKESGELEKYLVKAPGRASTHLFWWFGLFLILVSMTLLVFILSGFAQKML